METALHITSGDIVGSSLAKNDIPGEVLPMPIICTFICSLSFFTYMGEDYVRGCEPAVKKMWKKCEICGRFPGKDRFGLDPYHRLRKSRK